MKMRRNVLVSGANRGIGRAFVGELLERGAGPMARIDALDENYRTAPGWDPSLVTRV